MDFARFQRVGNVLTISGDLMWPLDVKFDIETSLLLKEAAEDGLNEVTIDVCDVTAMGSQYIGALAAVASELRKRDGGLTVKARGKVAGLLTQCGLSRLMKLALEE